MLLGDHLLTQDDPVADSNRRSSRVQRLSRKRALGRLHGHRLAARNVKADRDWVHRCPEVIHVRKKQVPYAAGKELFGNADLADGAIKITVPRGCERQVPLGVSIHLTGRRDAWKHLLPKAQHWFFGPELT